MKSKLFLLVSVFVLIVIVQSCSSPESESDYESSEGFSTSGSRKSHNTGQNCMGCHKPGGGEAPTWRMAGTIFNETLTLPYANAIVKLYTGPNATGTLKYTVNVDALGNFYTSSVIDFTGGLYPSVSGITGTNSMSSPITTGSCFSCHDGATRGKIWTN
ncbi:MAG: hypothetical protein RL619_1173 [Bacteroidota bacterium]|jgi:hypothetical protein